MDVKHRLSGGVAVVEDQTVAVLQPQVARDFCGSGDHGADHVDIGLVHLVDRRHVLAWDDEHVRRRLMARDGVDAAALRASLRGATASALTGTSVAKTLLAGRSRASVTAMQPVPVPASITRAPRGMRAIAVSTRISVSGRGISTRS